MISDSIKKIRKALGLTQEKFAANLGVKRSLIGAYEEGRAEPRLELLYRIAQVGSVSVESLLDKSPSNGRSSSNAVFSGNNIQLVPIVATAGYLKGFADPEYVEDLPKFSLPMLGKGNYRAFEISGDSMLPLLSGTVVVGERVDALRDIKSGKTYILITWHDGIVYKRVFNYLADNGKFFLVSDNPANKPYSVEPGEIAEAWAARAYISIQFPDQESKFTPHQNV